MKKIYFILLALLSYGIVFAAFPEAGKKYFIKNKDAGLYLRCDPGTDWKYEGVTYGVDLYIDNLLAKSPDFQFEFTSTGGSYYQMKANGGTYYFRAATINAWSCYMSSTPDGNNSDVLFTPTGNSDEYIISSRKNEGANLGLDGIGAGEHIYYDKGSSSHPAWIITEVPDVFELEIISRTPAVNATGASHADNILVVFNDLISLAPSPVISIKSSGGFAVAVDDVEIQKGNILSISHATFEPSTSYTVTIPAGTIEDYDEEIEWSFTTSAAAVLPIVGHSYQIFLVRGDNDKILTTDPSENYPWTGRLYTGSDYQKFEFESAGDADHFYIKNFAGFYMGVNGGNDAMVQNKNDAIVFSYQVLGDAIYITLNDGSDCLATYNGDWIYRKPLSEGAYKLWKLVDLNPTGCVPVSINSIVSISGNTVIISSENVELVKVYSASGALVKQTADSQFTLEQGFYIIRAGVETVKIIIK